MSMDGNKRRTNINCDRCRTDRCQKPRHCRMPVNSIMMADNDTMLKAMTLQITRKLCSNGRQRRDIKGHDATERP
jgi:predicted metal-binding protein